MCQQIREGGLNSACNTAADSVSLLGPIYSPFHLLTPLTAFPHPPPAPPHPCTGFPLPAHICCSAGGHRKALAFPPSWWQLVLPQSTLCLLCSSLHWCKTLFTSAQLGLGTSNLYGSIQPLGVPLTFSPKQNLKGFSQGRTSETF